MYSFVTNKTKKVWLLYAYAPETDEILAVTVGRRSKKTLRNLLNRLGDITVDVGRPVPWGTDGWKAFAQVLPYDRHLTGKRFTRAIEPLPWIGGNHLIAKFL